VRAPRALDARRDADAVEQRRIDAQAAQHDLRGEPLRSIWRAKDCAAPRIATPTHDRPGKIEVNFVAARAGIGIGDDGVSIANEEAADFVNLNRQFVRAPVQLEVFVHGFAHGKRRDRREVDLDVGHGQGFRQRAAQGRERPREPDVEAEDAVCRRPCHARASGRRASNTASSTASSGSSKRTAQRRGSTKSAQPAGW
jgi:hypothetical protein